MLCGIVLIEFPSTKEKKQLWKCFCRKTKIFIVTKKNCYLSNNRLLVPLYKEVSKNMLSCGGTLCHKHTNKEIRCFANFFSEETAQFFFKGHFCFLATRKFCINLYLPSYGNRSTQVLSMAVELWKIRKETNWKKCIILFWSPVLIQIIWSLFHFLGFANYKVETRSHRYSIVIK